MASRIEVVLLSNVGFASSAFYPLLTYEDTLSIASVSRKVHTTTNTYIGNLTVYPQTRRIKKRHENKRESTVIHHFQFGYKIIKRSIRDACYQHYRANVVICRLLQDLDDIEEVADNVSTNVAWKLGRALSAVDRWTSKVDNFIAAWFMECDTSIYPSYMKLTTHDFMIKSLKSHDVRHKIALLNRK